MSPGSNARTCAVVHDPGGWTPAFRAERSHRETGSGCAARSPSLRVARPGGRAEGEALKPPTRTSPRWAGKSSPESEANHAQHT